MVVLFVHKAYSRNWIRHHPYLVTQMASYQCFFPEDKLYFLMCWDINSLVIKSFKKASEEFKWNEISFCNSLVDDFSVITAYFPILFYPIPHGLFNLRADSWAFLRSRPFHHRQPLKVKVSEIPRVVLQDQTKSAKDTTEYVALLPSQLDY